MSELIKISPEGLEVANLYLASGSLQEAANSLNISVQKASELLDKAEVKRYIDSVYMDQGYRNRFKLAALMDKLIDSKVEEAEESEMYTTKDLADLIALQHKMKMEEIKAEQAGLKHQTNIQVNQQENIFGGGNYGDLMKKLLQEESIEVVYEENN